MAEDGYKVSLNVYDLSQGLARQLSTTFLGKAIEGIWHTGVVVYGNEYYFGGGIQNAPVGTTPYGNPVRVVDLGTTFVPKELFEEYLEDIRSRYTAESYSLLRHNCNNFTNEVSQFLVGNGIPDYILQLPNEVLNSPMGPLILPMIQQLETTLRAGAVPQAPQFRPTSLTQPLQPMAAALNTNPTVSTTREKSNDKEVKHEQVPADSIKTFEKTETGAHGHKITEATSEKSASGVARDPLGDARSRIQEEIGKEFASLMATGELRAGEAAALATRKVMERYGLINVAVQQS